MLPAFVSICARKRKEIRAMKVFLKGMISALVLCGLSLAQDANPAQPGGVPPQPQNLAAPATSPSVPDQANAAPRIAPGSVIPVQLSKGIDAKKAKTGDAVEGRVTQDMKTSAGEVVVPKDTKVIGHVTAAQARTKEQKESQVGIAFDHAVMKDGSDVALPMSIQAVVGPENPNAGSNGGGGGGGGGQPSPAPANGGTQGNGNGRPGSMGSGASSQAPTASSGGEEPQTNAQATSRSREPITGKTQGVVGIPDLKLAMAASATQGSVLSSEKNNVKLDGGTLLLLRVNP
jgi:hypothetical protein